MSRHYQSQTFSLQSSSNKKQPRFAAPPVIQPKRTKKPDMQLQEWKPGGSEVNPLAQLQQTLQAKLTIGQPNDKYEQEADRVARNVVQRINSPVSDASSQDETLHRETGEDELQRKAQLQRQENLGGGEASSELESSINRAKGGGQPLDSGLQQSMGQAMGADFSGVRVHADAQSDRLNQSIQARAFTTGRDVFFRQGNYNPGSKSGQELIAHELTHVVQQGGAGVRRQIQRSAIATPAFQIQSVAPNIIQRDPTLDLEKKWPYNGKNIAKYDRKYDDVNMRQTGVKSGGDKGLGTLGLGPCCALIVACKVQGEGWVVGMHHYSGANMRGHQVSITDTYNNLHNEVTTTAQSKGTVQYTRKYLIPGTGSAAHTESIEEFEQATTFDNDWRQMLADYETDGHTGSISVTIEEVGHWFKPNDLKIKYYYTQ